MSVPVTVHPSHLLSAHSHEKDLTGHQRKTKGGPQCHLFRFFGGWGGGTCWGGWEGVQSAPSILFFVCSVCWLTATMTSFRCGRGWQIPPSPVRSLVPGYVPTKKEETRQQWLLRLKHISVLCCQNHQLCQRNLKIKSVSVKLIAKLIGWNEKRKVFAF